MKYLKPTLLIALICVLSACKTEPQTYDLVIRNGQIFDGSGEASYKGDVAINADTIAAIGNLENAEGTQEIDATGLSVAPGFINMLSWANESLIEDGRSQGDIRQGVTLEVLGEGNSMGPLSTSMKKEMIAGQQTIKYDIPWTTLGGYLEYLEKKGISTNVASFIGNATLRKNTIGYENRPPTPQEMGTMKKLVRQAMEEGAVGLSTSLIYVPSGHAKTDEIIELAKIAAEYDGMYVSHIRDEEGKLLEAVQELITIAEEADITSEIYHFKASGNANWQLLDSAIQLVDNARKKGLPITTDMYMYNASSTGLNVLLPAWAKEGGHAATIKLIEQKDKRAQMMKEVDFHVPPENILMVGFRKKEMRTNIGKTLADIATERKISPEEAIVDLIYEDNSRIQVVYFSMSEENIKKKLALPYMSICSDAGSYTNEGVFLEQSTHPRAYGSFARLLGKFVREDKVVSLEDAIYKLTSLPATNLKLKKRGALKKGYFADITVFDANTIKDNATFEKPHQYATGMQHVFVNGTQVLKDGEHTGAFPGRVVRGPGWKERKSTIIAEGASLTLVADDYEFTEGPTTDADGNIFFTDQPNDRILKWSAADNSVSDWMQPSGRSNGLYFDHEGNLLSCADEKNQLWRIDSEKNVTVLIDKFEGKLLGGPNDLWADAKGGIYFTDPLYERAWWEPTHNRIQERRVYYRTPSGELKIVAEDFVQPNGIIGSADGKTLYVADIGLPEVTGGKKTYAYDINEDGSLTNRKLFCEMGSDGMTLDNQGNVYLTGDGVTVFDKTGKQIEHIAIGKTWTANVTFGGENRDILFITARDAVFTLKMNVQGVR